MDPAHCSIIWQVSDDHCCRSSQVSHFVLHQGSDLLQAASQLHLLSHWVLLQGTDNLLGQQSTCLKSHPCAPQLRAISLFPVSTKAWGNQIRGSVEDLPREALRKAKTISQSGLFQHRMTPVLYSLYLDWATPNPICSLLPLPQRVSVSSCLGYTSSKCLPSPLKSALGSPGHNTCGCGCKVLEEPPDSGEQRYSSMGSMWWSVSPLSQTSRPQAHHFCTASYFCLKYAEEVPWAMPYPREFGQS